MTGFRTKLAERQSKAKSLVCVGLDPLLEKLPKCLEGAHTTAYVVENWMTDIAQATGEYASMFKPQIAHWEAIPGGIDALKITVANIHDMFPDIPVFLDCKRGDIARTQQQYRVACFDNLGADGINFSPYMGKDCMAALVEKANPGRALVGLCYTSNPDAREIQDILLHDGKRLWQFIAERTLAWARELGVVENAGLVMAAAYKNPKGSGNIYSEHLVSCRQIVSNDLWFLIPGVGAQGGFIIETVRAAYKGPGSIAINSSSEINFASSGEDYAEAAAQKARELRDKINASLE
jgi:orotidine-5'-phosphate decarboxylase